MKISELIKQLKYELKSTGDSEVLISIATAKTNTFEVDGDLKYPGSNIFTTNNLLTSLDVGKKGLCTFSIRNWLM